MRLRTISTCSTILMLGLMAGPAPGSEDWDTDGDGVIQEQEFLEGLSKADVFKGLDINADDQLSDVEVGDGYGEKFPLTDWDTDLDGLISEREFGEGAFRRGDADSSGAIDASELGAASDFSELIDR